MTLPPFAGAGTDQLTLELGHATKDGEHEPPVGGRSASPAIPQRLEARALVGNSAKDIQKIPRRSGQAIQAGHY
jgi:hypothetical protein